MNEFPIKTKTGCILKWSWSTIFLKQGETNSCHRCALLPIDPDNFANFHNLPGKVEARETMLRGEWPQAGCQSCQRIEEAGGKSYRMNQFDTGRNNGVIPIELFDDPTATEVVPTILEIYFNNVCNMACVYCDERLSSKWEEENRKFGSYSIGNTPLINKYVNTPHYDQMLSEFWRYLENYGHRLRYFQILGGEPFFQKEFDDALDFWEAHPNPQLSIVIVTNLKVPPKKFKAYLERFKRMIAAGACREFHIAASLDAWGPAEEYVRQGLDLEEWRENFEYAITQPLIKLGINATISSLTIKGFAELLRNISKWNKIRQEYTSNTQMKNIKLSFQNLTHPTVMRGSWFGPGVFDDDFATALAAMPAGDPEYDHAKEYLLGISKEWSNGAKNVERINELKVYLTELDRRRNTNWKETFPWLNKEW